MYRYCVFMPAGADLVAQKFPEAYKLADGIWAVGSALPTCVDVCEALGMGPDRPGVVATMEEYYGHYNRALWQKLDSWSRT